MRAGLDASTVTPGSTAPEASLTVPATLPRFCAAATYGTLTSPRARSRIGVYCRRTLRITVLRVVMESCGGFSLCEPLFPERRTYTPQSQPCQGWPPPCQSDGGLCH